MTRTKRKPWSSRDLYLLRELYPHVTAETLATELGRPLPAIYCKANRLGLKKSEEFLTSALSARIQAGKQSAALNAARFQKGMTPWNKGTKGLSGQHPNTRATQFTKGTLTGAARHNYLPIGSLRISAEGHLERKVTDNPKLYPARRWEPVYRQVWVKANGPIPKGSIVVFRPGMKTAKEEEITLDRLECITRAENAQRNHPRTRSPELGRLVQLKGAITRQVNRINREAEQASKGAAQ